VAAAGISSSLVEAEAARYGKSRVLKEYGDTYVMQNYPEHRVQFKDSTSAVRTV